MNTANLLLMLASGFPDSYYSKPYCGSFEVYQGAECAPACDPTCDNLDGVCPPQIGPNTAGCFCIQGYVRDENNRCIAKQECPPKCLHPNEVWYPDCNAPKCEQTCKNWGQACEGTSHSGCFCGKGFARDNSGNCIPVEQCMYSCTGKSEIFISPAAIAGLCTWRCTEEGVITCDYKFKSTTGCSCLFGNVRNIDGECIPSEECTAMCPIPVI